jgi:hypothetical protein
MLFASAVDLAFLLPMFGDERIYELGDHSVFRAFSVMRGRFFRWNDCEGLPTLDRFGHGPLVVAEVARTDRLESSVRIGQKNG